MPQFVGSSGVSSVARRSEESDAFAKSLASVRELEGEFDDLKVRVFKRLDVFESEFLKQEKLLRDELEVQDIRIKRAEDYAMTVAKSGWKLLDDRVIALESKSEDSRIPALSEGYAKLADQVDNVNTCQRRLIKSLDAHHASHESFNRRLVHLEAAPKPKNNDWVLFFLTLFTSAFGFAAFLKIFFFL